MLRPVLVTPPATPPISLEEAKRHLRVEAETGDEDLLIAALIDAATAHLDGHAGILGGRCLISQTWRQDFACLAPCLRVPLLPVVSIDTVAYVDVDGATRTIDAANWTLLTDGEGAYIRFKDAYALPATTTEPPAASITFTAGYGDALAVPAPLKQAMLLKIGAWYENREDVAAGIVTGLPEPAAAAALLGPYRRIRV